MMSKAKFSRILGWITAGLILVVAAALIICCVSIYLSGERPFSREVIATSAGRIAIYGYLCFAAVATGLVISSQNEKTKAFRDEAAALERYHADVPEARKEQKLRRIYRTATAVLIAMLAVFPVIYYCDVSHFSVTDLSGDIIRAVLVALVPTVLSLVLVYVCDLLSRRSISREIALYRQIGVKPGKVPVKKNTDPKVLLAVRCMVLAVAVIFIIAGIANDGVADVLGKAIRICTECIGLG